MAKSSKKEIERDEKKVLTELMKDSSQSINDISDKLGFSRQKVWRIIKKLQDEKTIWGYTAIVDNEKLGMKSYILMGKRSAKTLPKDKIDLVLNKNMEKLMKNFDCYVEDTFYLNGEYDFLNLFRAPNLADAKKYQEELNRLFHGYLDKLTLFEILFPIRRTGIFNPDAEKFREFF